MGVELKPARVGGESELGANDGVSVLDELMTAAQIARMLQIPQSTVEDYARRKLLPSIKLGRHRRFIRSEIEQAITQLTAYP